MLLPVQEQLQLMMMATPSSLFSPVVQGKSGKKSFRRVGKRTMNEQTFEWVLSA